MSNAFTLFISCLSALIILMATTANAGDSELVNVTGFNQGTVLVSYSSEFGDRNSVQWIGLGLIDGTPEMGWASAKNAPFPHEFLFELARPYEIESLAFDTRNTEESGYPGIAARNVTVSASLEGRGGPFQKIYEGVIKPQAITQVNLPSPTDVRWLKLSITGNGGDDKYTELMEFMAYGKTTAPERKTQEFSATYNTNWNKFFMIAEDNGLRGCYDYDQGVFSGSKTGNYINIEWRETGQQIGKAVMAITEDGAFFNGFWYESGAMKGTWSGSLAASGEAPACAKKLLKKRTSELEDTLNETGRAVMYGVYFDHDSDVIKPKSGKTLAQVLAWLKAHADKSVVFEGHTDSDGSEAYNLDLSSRRAMSVKRWLTGRGIAGERMAAKGIGEARPVASNSTAQGKSLNRRVEITIVGN